MKIQHWLTVTSKCPVQDRLNSYRLKVTTDRLVMIEDILKACEELTKEAMCQETLTQSLCDRIACAVTSYGWHSGVHTVCECE